MVQPFTQFKDFKQRYPIRPNDEGALLGSGSYGRVFKVEDQLETEWVAIKISEFKGNDPKSLKAEVELAQRVPRQGNIARYDACYRLETDTGVSDFAIMKYYPDGNLVDLFRREKLTSAQICDITRGILLGLQHLHRNRIVHRDFKPANILISRDNAGRFIPKIADFGLSKLVADEELDSSDFDLSDGRGTPSYKAPEQIEGSRVSFNLDLWAFGVILYEMLTGEKPFRSDLRNSSEQSVRREIEKKIVSVELPARISQIDEPYQAMIRRCLVRDIHERVRKEDELLDLLDAIPQLLADAKQLVAREQYEQAIPIFERILNRREHHAEAETGLTRCRTVLTARDVSKLLNKADTHVERGQFEEAKANYEQVLRLDLTHQMAARGLALCVDRLRAGLVEAMMPVVEGTDVYQEGTDVYRASEHAPVTVPLAVIAPDEPLAGKIAPKVADAVAPRSTQPVSHPQTTRLAKPTVLWKVVAPVGLGLMGLIFYYNLKTTPSSVGTPVRVVTSTDTVSTAGILPRVPEESEPETKVKIVPVPVPVPPKEDKDAETIKKRVDIALDKARQAYSEKNYAQAEMLTRSALQLDPASQDAAGLHKSAVDALAKQTGNTPPIVEKNEPAKPLVAEPVVEKKDPIGNEKQQAQEKYDELIDAGVKAINNGNNKTKAIADFNSAHTLAKQHDLNTAKADAAYTKYTTTADRIFESDDYEMAKKWYTVVQALKDTPDVRKRIKQCTDQ